VWIDAGSRAETSETNGTAHFLEHLAFKVRSAQAGCLLNRLTYRMTGYRKEDATAIGVGD
jgi:predicted Zn-dependent peptidase